VGTASATTAPSAGSTANANRLVRAAPPQSHIAFDPASGRYVNSHAAPPATAGQDSTTVNAGNPASLLTPATTATPPALRANEPGETAASSGPALKTAAPVRTGSMPRAVPGENFTTTGRITPLPVSGVGSPGAADVPKVNAPALQSPSSPATRLSGDTPPSTRSAPATSGHSAWGWFHQAAPTPSSGSSGAVRSSGATQGGSQMIRGGFEGGARSMGAGGGMRGGATMGGATMGGGSHSAGGGGGGPRR